jgi:phage-related protein
MPDNKIGLEAIFENAQFQQGISSYNASVKDASSNTDESASTMSAAWEGLSAVGAIAFTAIGVGIAAMTAALGLAVTAAMETEDVMARMEFVVGNVGERTGVTADDVLALADSLSQVLPIDDEVITQAITMGLTFDGVNKDNIQPLISAAADLAAWTGKDLPAAMRELSMAISDPDKAMRLLRDANITLTDSEMDTLKGFKDVGDTAGATTFLLEQLKTKGIIGLGEAMGQTASGKMTIMQTALGNLQEALGGGLLEALKGVFDKITEFANNPDTIGFFTELGAKIGEFASAVIARMPDIMTSIQGVVAWLSENKPLIVGILAAIGVALAAFGYTAAAAGIAAMAGLWPVIAVMAVIGVVVGVLYKAWTENWGGIQGKVAKAWAQMKPVFDKLQAWLAVNMPKAIKALSDFWTKTLLPAIEKVVGWIVDNVLPLLVDLVLWLGDNIPKAIKTLSDFWTKTLLPAIQTVADWIDGTLMPILSVLRDWLETYLTAALETLSDIWLNVLLPAITAVFDFIQNVLIPAFQAIAAVISGVLTSALNALSALWTNVLLPAITAVWSFIQNYLVPIFNALSNLMTAVVGLAVAVLAAVWKNVLLPTLTAVWDAVSNVIDIFQEIVSTINGALSSALNTLTGLWKDHILPALTDVYNFIDTHIIQVLGRLASEVTGNLMDALNPFVTFLEGVFLSAFEGIRDAIQWVVNLINEMIDAVNSFVVPDWWPALPSSSNNNFMGFQPQLQAAEAKALPIVTAQLNILASLRDVAGGSTGTPTNGSISNSSQKTNTYVYGANFNVSGPSGFIEVMQGLK